ncbi:MAG TPA: DNA glycosylase [Chloroflexota bacterium]|jgi:N-glycosylase/DNA lyase|nr:DNA glycosylase [Chloroflexota bacterium]
MSSELTWRRLATRTLDCRPDQLDLIHTLDCGQAFRWRWQADAAWIGVVGELVVRVWRDGAIRYQAWPEEPDLWRYFRLDVDLAGLPRDAALAEAMAVFPGLRVLGQPPLETLLTFVCSPASNIVRITRSVDLLARLYGQPIGAIDGQRYFAFPSLAALAATTPGELMARTGLGFRGRYLRAVADELLRRPSGWVDRLAGVDYDAARAALQALPSVGPKIADCACLFGLCHDEAVPVDTHVWGLARELFPGEIPTRTLTPAAYGLVLGAFKRRYGRWAGWAQQYLYHARRVRRDLPMPSRVSLLRA